MSVKLQIMKGLSFIPDQFFNRIFSLYKNGYWPNFQEPRSFNEKINHIKFFSKNPFRELAADRIKVRDYVAKIASECKLINLLWKDEKFRESDCDKLAQKFVIKASHGSGMVVVDKEKIKYKEVEEFLNIGLDRVPDYKFMCINGNIEMIQIDLDSFIKYKRNIYDKNFSLNLLILN